MKRQILITVSIFFLAGIPATVYSQGEAVAREIRSIVLDESPELAPTKYKKPRRTDSGRRPSPGQDIVLDDLVVFDAFKKHAEWQNAVIVADWTGSMYQYGAQILRWHKLNMKRDMVSHLVLFNDGDDNLKRPSMKRIGNTGGIYHTNPNNLEAVLSTIEKAVDNGNGAECEENDLEAVLEAQKTYQGYDYLILIADSKSWVRDMALLDQITVPVHVILCDQGPYVEDYLKLAHQTGGSVFSRFDQIDFSISGTVASTGAYVFNGKTYKK